MSECEVIINRFKNNKIIVIPGKLQTIKKDKRKSDPWELTIQLNVKLNQNPYLSNIYIYAANQLKNYQKRKRKGFLLDKASSSTINVKRICFLWVKICKTIKTLVLWNKFYEKNPQPCTIVLWRSRILPKSILNL